MNDIEKKTYIDKDETDSMEKNKQMKKNKLCAHTITIRSRGHEILDVCVCLFVNTRT